MDCAYCLGIATVEKEDNGEAEYLITWNCGPQMGFANQLIHKEYGIAVDVHYCHDIGDFKLNLTAALPRTEPEMARIAAFINYAQGKVKGRPIGKWDADTVTNAINQAAPDVPTARWSLDAVAEKITENLKLKTPLTGDYLRKLIERRKLEELWERWDEIKTGQK